MIMVMVVIDSRGCHSRGGGHDYGHGGGHGRGCGGHGGWWWSGLPKRSFYAKIDLKIFTAKKCRTGNFFFGAWRVVAKFYGKKVHWRLAQRGSENGGLSLTQRQNNGSHPSMLTRVQLFGTFQTLTTAYF